MHEGIDNLSFGGGDNLKSTPMEAKLENKRKVIKSFWKNN